MVSKTISIKISEAYVEEGKTVINGIKLRKFQEDLLDSLGKYDKILLRAPTGSGKTFTLILAAIKSYLDHDYYPVVGIYPSKALVYDQARSIYETLSRMNLSREGNKFTGRLFINNEEKGEITLNVYILTGEKKEIPKEFKFSPISIVLTVPEYPYMFMTAMNRQNVAAQVIEAATKYSFDEAVNELSVRRNEIRELLSYFSVFFNGYWFIDEFHLYSGIARSSMLILVEMFEKYNSVIKSNKSIVFSSATPVPIRVSKVIDVGVSKEGSKIRKATLVNFHLSSVNPQEELVNYIQRNESEIRGRKVAVIIDRVYYVAELCNKVKYAAVVWGLNKEFGNCKNVKENLDKEDFIIGNHAMSFGI
ncbi:MAG: DEAD/DEAH box helicase family protein, partial [Metallosphaera sp.]